MMIGWLLTTDGTAERIDVPDGLGVRDAVQTGLLSDLIGCVEVVPGVAVWHDLLAEVEQLPLNAAALGLLDKLLDWTLPGLPRLRGSVVIASRDDSDEPCGIGDTGISALRMAFGARGGHEEEAQAA